MKKGSDIISPEEGGVAVVFIDINGWRRHLEVFQLTFRNQEEREWKLEKKSLTEQGQMGRK